MFELTYNMLAAYTSSDYSEQRNEEARYCAMGASPEDIYASICNNEAFARIVKTGLYKLVCESVAEVTNAPEYTHDHIVTLLLCPTYPNTSRQFLSLIGVFGVPIDEFYDEVTSVVDRMSDFDLNEPHPLIRSLFGLEVFTDSGYIKQLQHYMSSTFPHLRSTLRAPALCAVLRRYLYTASTVCFHLNGRWLQMSITQFYRQDNWAKHYALSTMLTQTKRSTTYGDTTLKCVKGGTVLTDDGVAAEYSVLIEHTLRNIGLLVSKLANCEDIDEDAFKEKYWDCEPTQLDGVRVRRGSRLALENDVYEILVTTKAKEPVITVHVRGTDRVVTTNVEYWETPKAVDKVAELRDVLSAYIPDEQQLAECVSRVTECRGWRK